MAKIIVRPWEVGCCLFGCIFFGVERILLGKKKGVVGFGGVACRFCEFLEKKLVLFGFTVVKMVDEKWMKASPL